MKKYISLILSFLLISQNLFAISSVSNNFSVGKSAKIAGGYVTSLSRFDGSFESGTSNFTVSTGTLTQTASTEMEGNQLGSWAVAANGTLDTVAYTISATNTYELSYLVTSTDPSNTQICAVVNTVENGCTYINTQTTQQKASWVGGLNTSDSVKIRVKYLGSSATIKVDNFKFDPWTPQTAGMNVIEYAAYTGYSSKDGSGNILLKTKDTRSNESLLVSVTNSGYTKYTILRSGYADVVACGTRSATVNAYILFYDSSAAQLKKAYFDSSSASNITNACVTMIQAVRAGDYFIFNGLDFTDAVSVNFSIKVSAPQNNVIQAWQDGTDWKALTYTEVNALSGNQGFGTYSAGGVEWKRQGSDLLYKGKLTLGTTAASEARLPLPAGLVSADTTKIPTIRLVGKAGQSTNTASNMSVLAEPSVGYITFGWGSGTLSELTKMLGNILSSGDQYSFEARIPIQGWSSTPTLLALPQSKENVFSARITSTGTITSQSSDFISSVTKTGTGQYTLNFKSGVFTVAPSFTCVSGDGGTRICSNASTGTASAAYYIGNDVGSAIDSSALVILQKQGADYTGQGVFLANITPDTFVQTKGTIGPEIFSATYATTNTSTNCTASPCSYLDQIGNVVSSITRNSTGNYTLNLTKTYSKLKCTFAGYQVGTGPVVAANSSCFSGVTNANSCVFATYNLVGGGTSADSVGTIHCHGTPQ